MASITAFGQTGPKKNFACNDLVALAQSGFLYISGDPSLPPCKPPETQAYYFASLFAAAGVLAALYRRERTGQGDHVDSSMQETLATQEHIIRLWANEQANPQTRRQPARLGGAGKDFSLPRWFRLSLCYPPTLEVIFVNLERSSGGVRRAGMAQQCLPARPCR